LPDVIQRAQDKHCTYNLEYRRIRATNVAVVNQYELHVPKVGLYP